MNTLALSLISAVLMGLGATLTFDLWALFLKHTFKIPPSNICLVGRWLRYMPEGTFIQTPPNLVIKEFASQGATATIPRFQHLEDRWLNRSEKIERSR